MSPFTALVAGLAAVLSALALAAPSAVGSAPPRADDVAPAKASTASSSGVPLCC